jgi:hypothetical protein
MAGCADKVPVFDPDGHFLFDAEVSWVLRCGNLRLIRSRRGHVRRAYVKSDAPSLWLERLLAANRGSWFGFHEWQRLADGHRVRALKGIRGSR